MPLAFWLAFEWHLPSRSCGIPQEPTIRSKAFSGFDLRLNLCRAKLPFVERAIGKALNPGPETDGIDLGTLLRPGETQPHNLVRVRNRAGP